MAAYSRHDVDLFYWRTRAGTEVDFVVYGESGLQAFEVKNHGRVHSTDLRALRAFARIIRRRRLGCSIAARSVCGLMACGACRSRSFSAV